MGEHLFTGSAIFVPPQANSYYENENTAAPNKTFPLLVNKINKQKCNIQPAIYITRKNTHGQLEGTAGFLLHAFARQRIRFYRHLSERAESAVASIAHDDLHASAGLEMRVEAAIPVGIERLLALLESDRSICARYRLLDVHGTNRLHGLRVVHDGLEEFNPHERHWYR